MLNLTLGNNSTLPAISISTLSFFLWFATSVLVLITGFALYVLLACAFVVQRNLRKGVGILILNMIFIGLQHSLIYHPFFIATVFFGWTGGLVHSSLCIHFTNFYVVSIYTWNWCSVGLAVNRFVAVFKPHHYQAFGKRSVIVFVLICCWAIGFFTALAGYMGALKSEDYSQFVNNCSYANFSGVMQRLPLFLGIIGFYVPVTVAEMLCVAIFYGLVKLRGPAAKQIGDSSTVSFPRKTITRRFRLTRTVIAMTFWYFLCLIPIPIISRLFPDWYRARYLVQVWLRTLGYAAFTSNAVSPLSVYVNGNSQKPG